MLKTLMTLWTVLLLASSVPFKSDAFTTKPTSPSRLNLNSLCRSARQKLHSSQRNEEASDVAKSLQDKASRLRKEAEELEKGLKSRRPAEQEVAVKEAKKRVEYTSLKDSTWNLSFRLTSNPPSQDEDSSGDARYYTGCASIKFRGDGYTDIIDADQDRPNTIELVKFWGWDEEISREDGLKYLSFSADIILPKDDPQYTSNKPFRFYFNARVETDAKTSMISLTDGTITLKKELNNNTPSLFRIGGILAQFVQCGEFLCKETDER